MKFLKYLVAVMLATVLLSAGSSAQTELNLDYWDGFVTKGANILSGYTPDTNSVNLGSNIAGYDLGRFGLHSLLWGHLTWLRSPECSHPSTTDALRRRYLENANDVIRGLSMRCVVQTI